MKIRLTHTPYIANKIALDLVNSGFIELDSTLEHLIEVARSVLDKSVHEEDSLDEEVREILENKIDEIEFFRADERQLFWLVKREIALSKNIPLNKEDRYNHISHAILNQMKEEELFYFDVSENVLKNTIYKAISNYAKTYESLEEIVEEKIKGYKRRILPGSEEYDIIFEKLYEEELRKRGFL
ncbi:competence protein [Helicobacter monodelphidis]|uniref:DUF507 family protein n=1 Tax=Helicobacter sp. 15-1451 TaxID=2004995 RepID=UPI000DCECBFD|nr:DUF507 family protein [Helicobacter sp. 15-1451]RAX58680.1 competence protein [Helicobacter sp. 15-1451]